MSVRVSVNMLLRSMILDGYQTKDERPLVLKAAANLRRVSFFIIEV